MEGEGKLHIVMFPWLAFGHMIPYLELSKLIAQRGHKVSFISTPRNIDRLPKLPPHLSFLIHFVKLPLPHVNCLPENAEAIIDLPYNKVKYLKLAFDGLQEPLSEFLENAAADWILYDFAPYWMASIASKYNLSTGFFSIFLAAVLSFGGPVSVLKGNDDDHARNKPEDFTLSPKWVPFKSTVKCRLFEILRQIEYGANGDEDNVSDFFRVGSAVVDSDILAVRSCSEFEPEWLNLLEKLHHKPVFPVGQLPTTAYDSADDDNENDVWKSSKGWLDKRARGSVVYVAFGSEVKLNQADLTEIALGLELSGLPFFWVLRTRRGAADDEVIELPQGFEERNEGRGIVCTSWVPQFKILSHESIGGFLTHSGWSSVVEAAQFEKPLILLTFLADQGLHARQLEEKKFAFSVPRDEQDGSFTKEEMAKSLNMVMLEEEGRIYREKIKELKGVFCDPARQDFYVDNLLSHLQTHRPPKKQDQATAN